MSDEDGGGGLNNKLREPDHPLVVAAVDAVLAAQVLLK
jgi:hypothetical protein